MLHLLASLSFYIKNTNWMGLIGLVSPWMTNIDVLFDLNIGMLIYGVQPNEPLNVYFDQDKMEPERALSTWPDMTRRTAN